MEKESGVFGPTPNPALFLSSLAKECSESRDFVGLAQCQTL